MPHQPRITRFQIQERLNNALIKKKLKWEKMNAKGSKIKQGPSSGSLSAPSTPVSSINTLLDTTSNRNSPTLLTPLPLKSSTSKTSSQTTSISKKLHSNRRKPKPSGVFAYTESRTVLFDRAKKSQESSEMFLIPGSFSFNGSGIYLSILPPIDAMQSPPNNRVIIGGRGSMSYSEQRGVTFDRIAKESSQTPGPSAYNVATNLIHKPKNFNRNYNKRSRARRMENDRMNQFGGLNFSTKSAGRHDSECMMLMTLNDCVKKKIMKIMYRV